MSTDKVHTHCRCLRSVGTCRTPLVDGGKEGFCDNCYTPTLAAEHDHYHSLREEGLDRITAGIDAGLLEESADAPSNVLKHVRKRKQPYQGIGVNTNPGFQLHDVDLNWGTKTA